MAAGILILVGFAIMGWSVLGLINPRRFAEGSRARAFGVGVIGFALLMVGGAMLPPTPDSQPIQEPTIPDDMSYSIIDSTAIAGIKRSLDVRLNKRVTEDTLRAIALKLKSQDSRDYDRTFITYYLPGMTVGAGAWATTHFTPDLEVKILGLSTEEEKETLDFTCASETRNSRAVA